MLVKICGLRTPEHALAAAAAGADMIGLVFAPSRRQVRAGEAAAIVAAVRARPGPQPRLVGLFVNERPAAINALAEEIGLDVVQLSGDEPAAVAAQIARPVIKALRLTGDGAEAAWVELARAGGVRLLADAHVPGAYGGTGAQADWGRAAVLAADLPLILAGGLTPESVAAAVSAVRPAGVDVSSGVETDGVKDVAKIEAFIAAARANA